MGCCNRNCTCIAIIVGLIAAIALGVLYALGFVSTDIIFWAYLLIGVLGVLFAPLYAKPEGEDGCKGCFCRHRKLILTSAVGAILAAAVGLIVAAASTMVVAIVLGIATFFPVVLIVALVCLADCFCD